MIKVSLEEVLAYREKRSCRRQELLSEYSLPMACLCLNIPGEYKDFPWASRSFHEETEAFTLALEAEGIAVSHMESDEDSAGYTAYISADAGPSVLKTIALRIEENHLLGRLFDIDIYESSGEKLSREDSGSQSRPCLVCHGNAFACGRSRAHPAEELHNAVLLIMENWLRRKLGDTVCSAAVRAMMSEAAITPKPGLVDRANSGSHKDMDFFSFIDSASALLPWFRFCALSGFDSVSDPKDLFKSLRPPGRIAEVLMKKASGGVNVHRGYIFSLGLLSAAYGRLYRTDEKPGLAAVLEFLKAMTVSLGEDFSSPRIKESSYRESSHGEAVFAKTGVRGIRGEVSRGFPSVTEYALPLLTRMLKEGYSLNDAGIAVLLKLLAHAEDTNIIHRRGAAALGAIQEELRAFFGSGPGALKDRNLDMEAIRKKADALDIEFIAKNISPGGCADLLGTTLFLYQLLV